MKCKECRTELKAKGLVAIDRNTETNGLCYAQLYQCPKCKNIEFYGV